MSSIFLLIIFVIIILCCCGVAKTPTRAEPELETTPISTAFYEPTYQQENVEPIKESEAKNYIYDNIPFGEDVQGLLWSACKETGCPYELALSVIWNETRFQNINGDRGNSIGYMQVQPRWHQERMKRLGVTDLSDPLSNFRVGCDFLSELIEKYGNIEDALTCYNTGRPGTSKYATRIMSYMNKMLLQGG